MIDRTGMSDAEVLCRLFNRSSPRGMGLLAPGCETDIVIEEAAQILADAGERRYFDYLRGRVMKIDVSRNPLDPRFYDRDNGPGAAYDALTKP